MSDFKIGDEVIITNLDNPHNPNSPFLGIIGHMGKIVRISGSGFYYLNPTCVGLCWPPSCLAKLAPSFEELSKDSDGVIFV